MSHCSLFCTFSPCINLLVSLLWSQGSALYVKILLHVILGGQGTGGIPHFADEETEGQEDTVTCPLVYTARKWQSRDQNTVFLKQHPDPFSIMPPSNTILPAEYLVPSHRLI